MKNFFVSVSKQVISVFVVIVGVALLWVGFGVFRSVGNNPKSIANTYIDLINAPNTDKISPNEQAVLNEIIETDLLSNVFNQNVNQLKTMREVAQGNPVIAKEPMYYGSQNKYSTVDLEFNNNFTNPESKNGRIYLIRTGDIFTGGTKWKIYQIDVPKKDNIIDNSKNFLDGFNPDSLNPFNNQGNQNNQNQNTNPAP